MCVYVCVYIYIYIYIYIYLTNTEYLKTTHIYLFKGFHFKGNPLMGISSRKHIATILSYRGAEGYSCHFKTRLAVPCLD